MAVFAVYAATAQYHSPLNNDTGAAAAAAWQLAMHGNATLTGIGNHASWLFHVGGRDVTNRLPGVIFWATPFYFVLGTHGSPDVYPGALAAAAATALAVALTFVLLSTLVGRRTALIAALLLGFGTGTWTVSADQLWTHGPAQAAVVATVLLARRNRWLLAGIPAGFAILLRPHLGVVAAVLGLIEAIRTRRVRPLLISVGCLVGILILLVYNHDLWGHYTVFGGYADVDPSSPHLLGPFLINIAGALVSPERGMLVMTPVLLLLVPGLRRGWAAAPPWVRSAAIAGVAYVLLQLWLKRFSGGNGFYSYRVTLEGLALCVPILTLSWREWTARSRLRRTAFAVLAVVSVAIAAFGAIVPWAPQGINQPWSSYAPAELARHVGALPTTCSILVTIAAAIVAGRFAWTRHVAALS
jgi:hypothetical protein